MIIVQTSHWWLFNVKWKGKCHKKWVFCASHVIEPKSNSIPLIETNFFDHLGKIFETMIWYTTNSIIFQFNKHGTKQSTLSI